MPSYNIGIIFLETLVACLPVGLFNPNDPKRTLFDLEYYTMNDINN